MKKIILTIFVLMITQSVIFADEIIDSKGTITPCRIVTVSAGLIEYSQDGNRYFFEREKDSLIFNDYVDVREHLLKRHSVVRYNGKVIIKDLENVVLKNDKGNIDIPWYRVKHIGIYKP